MIVRFTRITWAWMQPMITLEIFPIVQAIHTSFFHSAPTRQPPTIGSSPRRSGLNPLFGLFVSGFSMNDSASNPHFSRRDSLPDFCWNCSPTNRCFRLVFIPPAIPAMTR